MKIINFTPGLGNQIFEYLFVEYLRRKYPDQQIYGYYNAKKLHKHNGLEVHNVFEISLPHHNLWSDIVAWLCRKLNGVGVKGLKATDSVYSEGSIYYDGWWQDKKYFHDNLKLLRFKKFLLDAKNESLLYRIKNKTSVALHVRRGDYLDKENAKIYGGICTPEYYKKAISFILMKRPDCEFFVFSNDINWVKKEFNISNVTYVSNNKGINSYVDMYLMSHCNVLIIANSTFSYWGAMLNKSNPIVIYPNKWKNTSRPDIFPHNWIAIDEKGNFVNI